MFQNRMQHSIKMVSRRTGLSPHVIRVWEKRYGAVVPERTSTNRRRYSEAEIERLQLLRVATAAGHTIGNVARLATPALQELVAQSEEIASRRPGRRRPTAAQTGPDFLADCLQAVEQHDAHRLDSILTRAGVSLGHHGLLQQVAAPLTQKVGEMWREGKLTAAHEHFATAALRTFLGNVSRPFALSENAPTVVVCTPAGQLHEMGAIIAAAAASDLGWRVVYLGSSLPAVEIAGVAERNRARMVALSIVYPEDDPQLPQELENLRRLLGSGVQLVAGGRAAPAYAATLRKLGAVLVTDLQDWSALLDQLRARPG